MCDLHFEVTSIRQTPCSKKKRLLPNALPKLNEWNGWGRDLDNSSINDSTDLLDSTTNFERESQTAQLKKQVKNLNDKSLQLIYTVTLLVQTQFFYPALLVIDKRKACHCEQLLLGSTTECPRKDARRLI